MKNDEKIEEISKFKKNFPNALTIFRLGCIPGMIGSFMIGNIGFLGGYIAATSFFGLAAITDFFDGKLARKWHVESEFGKLWDPIADKSLVFSALVLGGLSGNLLSVLPLGMEVLLASNNIVRSIIEGEQVASSKWGKLKMWPLLITAGYGLLSKAAPNLSVALLPLTTLTVLAQTIALGSYFKDGVKNYLHRDKTKKIDFKAGIKSVLEKQKRKKKEPEKAVELVNKPTLNDSIQLTDQSLQSNREDKNSHYKVNYCFRPYPYSYKSVKRSLVLRKPE